MISDLSKKGQRRGENRNAKNFLSNISVTHRNFTICHSFHYSVYLHVRHQTQIRSLRNFLGPQCVVDMKKCDNSSWL